MICKSGLNLAHCIVKHTNDDVSNTLHFYFAPEMQCHKSLLLSYNAMKKYVSEDTTMVVMAFY